MNIFSKPTKKLITLVLLGLVSNLQADTFTWLGTTAAPSNMTTSTNWSPAGFSAANYAPGTTDDEILPDVAPASMTTLVDVGVSFYTQQFDLTNVTNNYQIQVKGDLYFLGAGVVNNSTNANNLFNLNSSTAGNQTIHFADGASTSTINQGLITYKLASAGSPASIIFEGNSPTGFGLINLQGSNGQVILQGTGTTVQIGQLTSVSGSTVTLGTNDTLQFGILGTTSTIAGDITGDGNIEIQGGTESISPLSLTGTVTIDNAAIVKASSTNIFTTASEVILQGTANFNLVNFAQQVSNLKGDTSSTITLGNGTLDVVETIPLTFAGVISGSGNLSLDSNSTSTLTLSNTNTYTGTTQINGGVLQLSKANSTISASSSVTLGTDGTLKLAANNVVTDLNDEGSTAGSTSVLLGSFTLTDNGADDHVFSGVISQSGNFIKTGSGSLTLAGTNTYTGTTTITTGTIVGGIQDTIADSTQLNIGANGIFDLGGFDQTIQNLTGSSGGQILLGTNTLTIDQNAPAPALTFAGIISGDGNVLLEGGSTLILTANNTYQGTTEISAGILQLDATATIAASSQVTVDNGGTLQLTTINNTIKNLQGPTGSSVDLGSATLTVNESLPTTFAGVISNPVGSTGSLTKTGSATLTLTGGNSYTGTTTISTGTLALGLGGSLSSSGVVSIASGATFDISLGGGDKQIGDLTGAGSVTLGGNTLKLGTANSTTFSGGIGGAGGITKVGTGKLTLSGTNNYTGTTTISAGTLAITGTGTINTLSPIVVNATFDISGISTTSYTAGDISGSGVINLGGKELILGTSNTTAFSGPIQGIGGSLDKVGSGAFTLSGNSTYTGGTTVTAGTLAMSGTGTLFSTGPLDIATGATFDISAATVSERIGDLSGGGHLILGSNTFVTGTSTATTTFSGDIQGSGTFEKMGTGILVLSGNSPLFTGTIELNGGTLSITNANALGSPTTSIDVVSASTLQIGFTGLVSQHPLTLNAGLTLNNVSPNDATWSAAITGPGSLTKTGTAKLTLTGANNYSGGTTVSAGTLQGTTTSLQGNIVDNATVIFDQTTTGTYSGAISGSGAVIKQNTGTVIFTGLNTYNGGTTINGGVLQGNTTNLQGTIQDNATLTFDQTFDGTFDGTLLGAGTITKIGARELKIKDDQSGFTGNTEVKNGTLTVDGILGGNVTMDNSTLIRGIGKVGGDLHMLSGSTISPGHSFGTFSVGGNFTLDQGATYFCEVDALNVSDLIDVTGFAQINGSLFVDFVGPFTFNSGMAHILHTDAGRIGTFSSVTKIGALVSPVVIYTPNDIYLEWVPNVVPVALTTNQLNVAQQFDTVTDPTGDILTVLNALVNLNGFEARRALDAMSGVQYAAIPQINRYSNERFNKRIFQAVEELTEPCWYECGCEFFQPWFIVEKGSPSSLGDKYARSYGAQTLDLSLGAHVPFTKWFILGGAVNYEENEIQFNHTGKASWNIWQGSIYTILQQPLGYIFIDGIAGSGFGEFKRKIQFPGIDKVTKGKPTSHQGFLYTEGGLNLTYCNALIQPYFAGEFGYYKQKAFTETGADSIDLTVNAKTTNTVDSYLGAHLTTTMYDYVTLSADVAWHHRYGPDRFNIVNQFPAFGSAFDIKGSKIGNDALEGSFSVSALYCDNFSLFAEIAGERWYGWSAYSIDVGVSVWW